MASTPASKMDPGRVSKTGVGESVPNFLSSSPFIQEILCRQCRHRQLSPPIGLTRCPVTVIPRSSAIDIPGTGDDGRRHDSVSVSFGYDASSPQSIGQELRRIGDDFDRHFGSSSGGSSRSSIFMGRSRSLSFLQQLPQFRSHDHRRNSAAE